MEDKTKIGRVSAAVEQVLKEYPDGIRFVDLIRKVREIAPELGAESGLPQYIQWLPRRNPEKFIKPSRGVFQLVSNASQPEPSSNAENEGIEKNVLGKQWSEASFYQPFADYLVNDLDECGRATVLGGNKFGSKWGTPDVIGVTVPKLGDIYKPPIEIVSAEIKSNANDLVVAFGQACSYQLFSHKTYIVVPGSSKEALNNQLV